MSKKKVVKTPGKPGQPTKWRPELNDSLVAHFSGEHYEEKEIVTINRKTGEEQVRYETHAKSVPTFERWCANNNISDDNVSEWSKEEYKDKYIGFSDAYKKAKKLQHDWVIDCAITGKFNPAFAIFFAKNNMGMKDKVETEMYGKDGEALPVMVFRPEKRED